MGSGTTQSDIDLGVVTGGEVHDSGGWSSWRNRTDRVLETLFPLRR